MNPVFSILIPAYNVAKYIEDCIESIKKQTFSNFECIIVDDGSTDTTRIVIESLVENDSRFVFIHQENRGVSATRNKLLKMAVGEYVVWIDSDDWVSDDLLKNIHDEITRTNSDGCIYAYNIVNDKHVVPTHLFERDTLMTQIKAMEYLAKEFRMLSFLCNKVFKRYVYKDVVFSNQKAMLEDYTIMPLLFSRCSKICYVNKIMYNYRQLETSISHNISVAMVKENIKTMKDREIYILNLYPNLVDAVRIGQVHQAFDMISYPSYDGQVNMIQSIVRRNIFLVIKEDRMSLKDKMKSVMIAISLDVYLRLKDIYRYVISK